MRIIIASICGIFVVGFLIMRYSSVFGGKSSTQKVHSFNLSKNFRKGKFVNQIPTLMDDGLKTMFTILGDFIKGNPKAKPNWVIPVEPFHAVDLQIKQQQTRITWFGHSTALLEIEGKILLLDPVFTENPTPFPLIGGKRYSRTLPIELEKIPHIDAVIVSHDHYDHLDYATINKLKIKTKNFFVPLGVGSHLERWGVDNEKIRELDWWNESEFAGLRFTCTPARHFSGRSLFDRDKTLWCSWVLEGKKAKLYFSGDSGYGPHFAEIGEKYGPFDLTLMECGQYDERWAAIHMMPEQTVQAQLDVKGKMMIPIHWGAFTLAFHDWSEPIERVTKAANKRGVAIATPKIGEAVIIGADEYPSSVWWR